MIVKYNPIKVMRMPMNLVALICCFCGLPALLYLNFCAPLITASGDNRNLRPTYRKARPIKVPSTFMKISIIYLSTFIRNDIIVPLCQYLRFFDDFLEFHQ